MIVESNKHLADEAKPEAVGLSDHEAEQRLKQYGPNVLVAEKRLPGILVFLANFKNPLVVVLIMAAVLSAFFGDLNSFVIIVSIVVISALLDFVNTYRSEKAAMSLKEKVRVLAKVMRSKQWVELPLADIVPGDLIKLEAGKLVPADGKVVDQKVLYVNESSLTGESLPRGKTNGESLLLGSSVTSGEGLMIVEKTGKDTQFAKIAQSLEGQEPQTEFDREIKEFSVLIVKVTVALVGFVFLFNSVFRNDILQSLMFSLALAVGLTPELLPLIITLNLTKGSLAMAKHKVIVKKLSAIQNCGSMDVLCTDKTGTLTEDKIVLVKYVDGDGNEAEQVLLYSYITSVYSTAFENPLDKAVQAFRHLDIKAYKKQDEIPFDFERKRESVVTTHDNENLLFTKGAPEEVIKICDSYKGQKLTSAHHKKIQELYESLSNDGFRVLGVASKKIAKKDDYEQSDEHNLVFEGFIAFLDPAKHSAKETLDQAHEYGVTIKIITGDNALVTKRIASEVGLTVSGILNGPEVANMSDKQLEEAVENTTIFARVNPEQKMRIIKALQANQHVVGYMGDGVNDAPPLRAADVSISVNNATDVAKDTAHLILLEKSIHNLIEGIIEGRRTYANTVKYLMMSLGSNFGNVFSMAGGSLFLPFLPMAPIQVLLTNLLYDTSQFALPLDNVDQEDIKKPRKLNIKSLKKAMLVFGPLSSVFDFATFGALLAVFHLGASSFQTGWFIESVATQTFIVYIIRTKKIPFVESLPSKYLVVSTIGTVALGVAIALSHFGEFFKFGPIPSYVLLMIVVIVLVYMLTAEIVKRQFYKRVEI